MGFAFNVRYCGREITSISLKTPIQDRYLEKDCCGNAEKKLPCCKDKEVKLLKKSEELNQKNVSSQADFATLITNQIPCLYSCTLNFKNDSFVSYVCQATNSPLFKLYHQYIFYA